MVFLSYTLLRKSRYPTKGPNEQIYLFHTRIRNLLHTRLQFHIKIMRSNSRLGSGLVDFNHGQTMAFLLVFFPLFYSIKLKIYKQHVSTDIYNFNMTITYKKKIILEDPEVEFDIVNNSKQS